MLRKLSIAVTMASLVGCSSTYHSAGNHTFQKGVAKPNEFWWPKKIDLSPLRQHASESSPMGRRFNYAKEFKKLNLKKVKKEIAQS